MDDFELLDAVACADLVHRGEVAPIEIVDAAIARIEARNGELNAVVTMAFDRARTQAGQVDLRAPLAGVPFLVKDQVDWAGVRTTHGSQFLSRHVATGNSEVLRRWLAAGVVPLGKTNVPECGLLATTEPQAYGATGNPWDPSRTAGGSSGGSAAAVAAGLVPVASASDGGGSIRIPSAACGVFGLKPTRGRTPGAGWGGLSTVHVVSRSVRDSAAFLDATCGPAAGDVTVLERPERRYLDLVAQDPRRLRIAVTDLGWEGVRPSPEVIAAVRRTADLLSDLGHDVVEGRPTLSPGDIAEALPGLWRFVSTGVAHNLDLWSAESGQPLTPELFEPLTWEVAQEGRLVTGTELLASFDAQTKLVALVQPFFVDHDAWLLPTVSEVAPRNGEWQFPAHWPRAGAMRMAMFNPPLSTALANYTGQPAMSVPLENDVATGLPIGSQIYGRWGDEATLLQLAGQLERARPWAGRRPELAR